MFTDIFNIKVQLEKHRERKRAEKAHAAEKQAGIKLKHNNRLLRDAFKAGNIDAVRALLALGAFSEDFEKVTYDYAPAATEFSAAARRADGAREWTKELVDRVFSGTSLSFNPNLGV